MALSKPPASALPDWFAAMSSRLTQRHAKVVDLIVVQVGNNVLEHKLFRQHARSQPQILTRLLFVERLKCFLPLAHVGSGGRRLREDVLEDSMCKPVARALRPAA